jgi:hypothetical protein
MASRSVIEDHVAGAALSFYPDRPGTGNIKPDSSSTSGKTLKASPQTVAR